jgi:hypothetical protein
MAYKFRTDFAESGASERNGLAETEEAQGGKAWSGAMRRKACGYWAFQQSAGAGETVRIGSNGGALETQIQRSPYF